MRYGICTGLENLALVEAMGFDYIEPSVTSVMGMEAEALEQYRKQLACAGISCEAFNVLFPQTIELIGERADESALKEYLHQAMKLVADLGGKVVVFGSGKCRRCPDGYSYKKAYQELVNAFRITGEIAAGYGITIVIEPLSRTETNMIYTMVEGAILESDVNLPNVKLLSDYFHVISNHDSIDTMKNIGEFSHIHIAAGVGRLYPVSCEGEQYAEFISTLKAVGYDGRISIEGKTDDMEQDAPAALALLKELEAQFSM